MIGSRLGSYEILEEIGRGGMGCVYKARQPALNRMVAVKVLLPQLAADEIFVERFMREARSIATLEHPGIVTIYDVGEADGTYYFAMQMLDGQPLDEVLEEGKPLPLKTAVDVLEQVAQALAFAHDVGILHRDVKPGNIILTTSGQAVLTDFGIAQALSDPRLTKTGTSIGSPEYMAPEQIEGKPLDARADLYSLGVVFFQMITGAVPYKGASPVAVVYQHVKAPVPSAREIDPNIPEHIDRVTATLMAKEPEERYGSARELLEALRGEAPERHVATRKRRSSTAWIGVLIAVIGLALAAVYLWGDRPEIDRLLGRTPEVAPVPVEAPPTGEPAEPVDAAPPVTATPEPDTAATEEPPPVTAPAAETLVVTSQPPGATVVLDGDTLEGTTPTEVELMPETTYQIVVQLEGYEAAGLTFALDDLSESQRSSGGLHFPLRSSTPPGILSIAADYPVEVRVGDRTYTDRRIELLPGAYEAQISAPSVYFSDNRSLSIESGATHEVALPMATTITIAANPSRCRIKIDGRDAGYVPAEVQLTVGPHVFEFDWESLGETLRLTRTITAQTERVFATPPG